MIGHDRQKNRLLRLLFEIYSITSLESYRTWMGHGLLGFATSRASEPRSLYPSIYSMMVLVVKFFLCFTFWPHLGINCASTRIILINTHNGDRTNISNN